MDGLLRCTRYAFGPNRLHYCGPDASREILSYLQAGEIDPGLTAMLKKFETLFPYLQLIARANGIRDPFDNRVVEAYWLGNDLLEQVGQRNFYRHLSDDLGLRKKITSIQLSEIAAPLSFGAVPHHSYHVFSVWKRTGRTETTHTLESIDACRISWGTVTAVDGPNISVWRRPIIESADRLILGEPQTIVVQRPLDARDDIAEVLPGQIITLHWNVPCETISPVQQANLEKYTLRHLLMAAVHQG
ncbi:MAG: DUF6390 family protein [Patescibacteria group bacterium]